jgi:hypothetical protein
MHTLTLRCAQLVAYAYNDAVTVGWHKERVRVKAGRQRAVLHLCGIADTNTAVARHMWSKWRAQTRLESSTSRY